MSYVVSPGTVQEAIGFLVEHPEARPMSGGASLVAMKNARLVAPSHIVSLARIPDLRGIDATPDGVRIGGMSCHREVAESSLLVGDIEMIRKAARQIANRVVRNMGTMGGAIGNADPAADYLPVLACADAKVEICGPAGTRHLSIDDYVLDWYETALEAGEIVVAVHIPAPCDGRSVYRKLARTPGDYATVSVACARRETGIRVAVGACGPKPLRSMAGEQVLEHAAYDSDAIAAFGQALVDMADPIDDVRGTSDYRLRVIPRMVAAAIADARDPSK